MKHNYLLSTIFIAIVYLSVFIQQAYSQRPQIGGYTVYYGNLHNHTSNSDGKGTPAEAYAMAKNRMDFFSIADHCRVLDSIGWRDTKIQAAKYNEDGVFVAFHGFEWSGGGHTTVINTPDFVTHKDAAYSKQKELAAWLKGFPNGIAFLNHPGDYGNTGFFNWGDITLFNQIVGMELWNQKDGFNVYYYNDGAVLNDNNRGYWDETNNKTGWRLGGMGAEDNHDANWGYSEHKMAILANELTQKELLAAMKARRFYATSDKNIALSFKVNDAEMGSDVKEGNLEFKIKAFDKDGEKFTKVMLFDRNHNATTWDVNTDTVNIVTTINTKANNAFDYYYVKVTQADGNEAISSPIWIVPGPTAVANNLKPTPVIWSKDNNIRIDGIDAGQNIEVLTVDGRIVLTKKASSNAEDIRLEKKGIYIIKVANRIFKIFV
jgi:hypothetical protein